MSPHPKSVIPIDHERRFLMQHSPSRPAARILLAEADDITRAFLADNLTADGYDIAAVSDQSTALSELHHHGVDLVIADVNGQTLALLDTLRSAETPIGLTPTDVPMIVLTSNPDSVHRIRLLERGADDVVSKPVGYGEIRARVAAVLRRTAPRPPQPVITAGDLHVDLHRRQVTIAGQPVNLSNIEYRLLCTLAAEPTRVHTRAELLRTIWGHSADTRTRTLDSHAHRLRAKLAAADHPLVINVWGVGYRLIDGGSR
jgi:DNA-binding response OmpR family regulator